MEGNCDEGIKSCRKNRHDSVIAQAEFQIMLYTRGTLLLAGKKYPWSVFFWEVYSHCLSAVMIVTFDQTRLIGQLGHGNDTQRGWTQSPFWGKVLASYIDRTSGMPKIIA